MKIGFVKSLPALLIVALFGIFAFAFFLNHRSQQFPALPLGSFVGKISGIKDNSEESYSLYFERIGGANSLLVVVFDSDWRPQVIPLRSSVSSGVVEPVILMNNDVSFVLSGAPSRGNYSGEVIASDGRRGTWSVSPITPDELKQSRKVEVLGYDLKSWLPVKIQYNSLTDQLRSLQSSFDSESPKLNQLQKVVKDEDALRDRSKSRRDALADEINRVAEQRKKNTQNLRDALNDLSLLHRITKKGQAVELQRKIARREQKWFDAHWSGEDAPGDIEEQLAEQDQIDLTKLNLSVKRAQEIEKLRTSISEEKEKIRQLEAMAYERSHPVQKPANPLPVQRQQQPPVIQDEPKPWWKVWDDNQQG